MTIVRSVSDMKGLIAWNKLYKKYPPSAMARATRLFGQVVSPHRIKHIKDADVELSKWEERLEILRKEFGETY